MLQTVQTVTSQIMSVNSLTTRFFIISRPHEWRIHLKQHYKNVGMARTLPHHTTTKPLKQEEGLRFGQKEGEEKKKNSLIF